MNDEQTHINSFAPPSHAHASAGRHPGITLPELMVTLGIIVILLAILLPVLNTIRTQSLMASSQNNMRQISTWMRAYERDNREIILPSQFDYSEDVFQNKGRVRAPHNDDGEPVDPVIGERHQGTWVDILWTINAVGVFRMVVDELGHDYSNVAPDKALYDAMGRSFDNPFRSAFMNTRSYRFPNGMLGDGIAKPHGDGANEVGYAGYFAANDFFNARPDATEYPPGEDTPEVGRWWSTGQIRAPERSMYLVDSFVGEVIGGVNDPSTPENEAALPFDNRPPTLGSQEKTIEVDFRYSGHALMLMLDGSIRIEGQWQDLCDLECYDPAPSVCDCESANYRNRGIRITQLDRRAPLSASDP